MVKSVKAIILASVMVSMSVMLINSCGVSSPTGATATTGATTAANTAHTNAFSSFPSGKTPQALPKWMEALPSASLPCILQNPHLNLNATGPITPFDQLCGDYYERYTGVANPSLAKCLNTSCTDVSQVYEGAHLIYVGSPNAVTYMISSTLWTATSVYVNGTWQQAPPLWITNPSLWPKYLWTIPCNDPCLKGGSFPKDAFTGDGSGGGPFIGSDGTIYPGGGAPPITPDPTKKRILVAVAITPDTASISVGSTTNFTATAYYTNVPPYTDPITGMITSGDPTIATVNNGTVRGVADGQTTLKVTLTDPGNPGNTCSAASIVDVGGPPQSIIIEPASATISKGDTIQFTATAVYPNNRLVNITNYPGVWAIGNPGGTHASISNAGLVTGIATGTAFVTAKYRGVISGMATLTVVDKKLSSIKVDPTPVTIYLHSSPKQQQYTATGTFSDGSSKPLVAPVKWTSDAEKIATIDSTGKAIAVSPGTTYITAASDSIKSGAQDAELNIQCFNYTVHYRQNQGLWMNNVYNNYQATGGKLKSGMLDHSIGAVGCYLTSVANAMNATGTNVTPQQLNDWMVSPNDGFVGHNANANRAFDYPGSHIKAVTKWQNTNISDIKYQLSQCNIIFALVTGTTAFTGGHYVLIVKEDSSGRLMMLDPWKYSTDPAGVYYEYVDKRYTINQYQVLSVK